MNISHLYNKDIKYPDKTNEDFMWLMGLILGDGHIDLKNNKINIVGHQSGKMFVFVGNKGNPLPDLALF